MFARAARFSSHRAFAWRILKMRCGVPRPSATTIRSNPRKPASISGERRVSACGSSSSGHDLARNVTCEVRYSSRRSATTMGDVRKAYERWREKVAASEPAGADGADRKARFETPSAIEVRALYTPADLEEHDYIALDGFPGEFPFTRGVQPSMYRRRLWTMRQYAGFGSAAESNARYRYLLAQGQTGLSVAFDLPTQLGYDSDHPSARGEVGKVGVAIASLRDMEV